MTTAVYLHRLQSSSLQPLATGLAKDRSVGRVYVHRPPSEKIWSQARRRLGDSIQPNPADARTRWIAGLRAQAASLVLTEALWREIHAAQWLGEQLARFFGDPHAEYALKKSLIVEAESYLEALFAAEMLAAGGSEPVLVAPCTPLEALIIELLPGVEGGAWWKVPVWSGAPALSGWRWRAVTSAFRDVAGALARLGVVPLRRGWVWSGPRSRPFFKVASDNKWAPGQYLGARNDLFLVDGERVRAEDVLIVFNPSQPHTSEAGYRAAGATVINPHHLAVPLGFWLTDFVPRVLRFLASTISFGLHGPYGAAVLHHAIDLVVSSVDFEILLRHVRLGTLTSVVEYHPSHIIRTLVLNRYGGRTMRIPHSQLDSPGAVSAYLHYDMVCSSGTYLPTAWGKTWSPHTRWESVGLMFNQVVATPSASGDSERARELIAGLLAKGKRLVSILTGSNGGWSLAEEMDWRVIAAVLDSCARRDDLVIVIKPKGDQEGYLELPRFRALLDPHRLAGRVHYLHGRWGTECTAHYVMKHSTLCVAAHGSVVVEAMVLGVPVLVPPFPEHKTPWVQRFLGSTFFDEFSDFQMALQAALEGAPAPVDPKLVREWFDPFCDGRAVERMRAVVLALNRASPRLAER